MVSAHVIDYVSVDGIHHLIVDTNQVQLTPAEEIDDRRYEYGVYCSYRTDTHVPGDESVGIIQSSSISGGN